MANKLFILLVIAFVSINFMGIAYSMYKILKEMKQELEEERRERESKE